MKQRPFVIAAVCLLAVTAGSAAAAMPTRVQATQELAVLSTAHGAHRVLARRGSHAGLRSP